MPPLFTFSLQSGSDPVGMDALTKRLEHTINILERTTNLHRKLELSASLFSISWRAYSKVLSITQKAAF